MLKLLFTKVADVFDRDHQFLFSASVTISHSGETTLTFPYNVPLDQMEIEGFVTFYDDIEGLVTYWCSFFNLKTLNNEMVSMNLSLTDMVDQVQRRQDLKTSVRFNIEVDYTDHKGKSRYCKGVVENISAGGVFFTAEHKFTLGDSVLLRLFEIQPRLYARTNILRIQALDGWVSSPWFIKQEDKPLHAPKPPAPEGQNIFSFVRKRQAAEPTPPPAPKVAEPPKPKMAFEQEEDTSSGRVFEADVGGNATRYGYGCQFRRIGEGNEIAIRRFVFEQERLRLQKTRD